MKTYNLVFCLLALLVSLASCKKEETTEPKTIFLRAHVSNPNWTTNDGIDWDAPVVVAKRIDDIIWINAVDTTRSRGLSLRVPANLTPGTYSKENTEFYAFARWGFHDYWWPSGSSFITIERLDTEVGIIEGKFDFSFGFLNDDYLKFTAGEFRAEF